MDFRAVFVVVVTVVTIIVINFLVIVVFVVIVVVSVIVITVVTIIVFNLLVVDVIIIVTIIVFTISLSSTWRSLKVPLFWGCLREFGTMTERRTQWWESHQSFTFRFLPRENTTPAYEHWDCVQNDEPATCSESL